MLSHLSAKFQKDVTQETHEPRAALFLNRFTRTLTIMYATSGIEQVIGVSGEEMKGRSFYYCIAENCLEDAVKCLETAKGNDSIAYLRFWFRDPRQDDEPPSDVSEEETEDETMTDVTETEDEDGGVRLDSAAIAPGSGSSVSGLSSTPLDRAQTRSTESGAVLAQQRQSTITPLSQSGTGSGHGDSRSGSNPTNSTESSNRASRSGPSQPSVPTSPSSEGINTPIELEAVVSCTSDGLVVILRRARPLMPGTIPEQNRMQHNVPAPVPHQYPRGIFAAPWAPEPVFIPAQPRPAQPGWYHGMHPQYVQPMPPPSGPSPQDFMNSIREVAVFAWALVGINGNLANYGRGHPGGESQPPGGFPVWDPEYKQTIDSGNVTQTGTGATTSPDPFGQANTSRNF